MSTSSTTSPRARFRAAVHKVIAMRHESGIVPHGRVGAEPGIDPRRESAFFSFAHIRQQCQIEIVDYSSVRSSYQRMVNSEFIQFLADPEARARRPWSKVRWINVGGISWDIVSSLALAYGKDIHPLAVEDVLHESKVSRSKADYYQHHLFLRILCHNIASENDLNEYTSPTGFVTNLPRTTSPGTMEDIIDVYEAEVERDESEERTVHGIRSNSHYIKRGGLLPTATKIFRQRDNTQPPSSSNQFTVWHPRFANYLEMRSKVHDTRIRQLIHELKKGDRVDVKITAMCMFLLRDGTVITIHPDTTLQFTAPIVDRLKQRDSGLRTSSDASLLVEGIIDLIVDNALEVVEEYQRKLLKLEQSVLLRPLISHVRRLHIIQGDLILHKRTLEPIKALVSGLRRYDVDRVAALSESLDPMVCVHGYMSHKAKTYLADVQDHVEYILSSLDMFTGVCENLVNYTFNMSSHEMNEVMRRLTLATIIFLPLTLLTGYFGMNFSSMWSIKHGHSDIVFWIIALPLMAIILPIFLWSDLEKLYHYMRKKMRLRTTMGTEVSG
ncbi:hypothetical protein PHLGIDRAFT_72083 [Phlebiopsis gigantea 11061_1 CR5-6]|uniref:Magnesium transport protein CorA n=1 Tax=Phlebiopsis gigantea (strain 11061_1 CR5-6) TaxID=745531 RepID=A0A0C3SA96_PHLG1|nr:hypothetical protein PHLGIDRAFT_72083 [Phlebiopsis gigantea 11061_1 CR5-6]